MELRENLPLMLAGVAFALAVVQEVHPFARRLPPGILFAVALLLALRWVLRKQARKRHSAIGDVPKHPLGISGDQE